VWGWDNKAYIVPMSTTKLDASSTFDSWSIVNFKVQTSWKPIIVKPVRVTDDNFLIDNLKKHEFNSSKYEWVKGVNFAKQKSREGKDSRLPTFMDGLNNRFSIGGMSWKMYELNHYDDSNFPSLIVPDQK